MKILQEIIAGIHTPDPVWREKAKEYINTLAMPPRALGKLLDIAEDLVSIQETLQISVKRKKIILMAADHGITAQGVSPSPKEVTAQMIGNFAAGTSGMCVLAQCAGAETVIVDAGVDADLSFYGEKIVHGKIRRGTADFSQGPAMTKEEALASLHLGISLTDSLAEETDLFATGEMGIGNTSASSAVISVLCRKDLAKLVGMGAGLAQEKILHKIRVIQQGIELNQPDPADPLDVLAKVGGLEIGGMAGVILGSAAHKKCVLIDGLISGAAALIAAKLAPESVPYMIFSHRSTEPGHIAVTEELGKDVLLDLHLRLGEGSGCACAMPLLDQACAIMNHMATFQSANINNEGL